MQQKFYLRSTFIITSLLILLVYSSEIDFMPNYVNHPDKIYLSLWMLLIYPVLFFIIGWSMKSKIKVEKMEISIFTAITIISFAMLNNPKGNSQIIGYLSTLAIWLIAIIRLIIIKRNN